MTKLEKSGLKLARMIVEKAQFWRDWFGGSDCPKDEIEDLAQKIVQEYDAKQQNNKGD